MSVNLVNKSDGSLSKIAGKVANGELIPSVSYYQSGQKTSDTTSWSTGETGTFTINLSENMPDTDYIVVPTLNVVGVSAIVHSKTVNSFKVTVRNDREETIAQAITLYWQAFKLMTNEQHALDETAIEQNTSDISDLQDDKQDKNLETPLTIGGTSRTTVEGALGGLNGVVPSGASASNQLIADDRIIRLAVGNRNLSTIQSDIQTIVESLAVGYYPVHFSIYMLHDSTYLTDGWGVVTGTVHKYTAGIYNIDLIISQSSRHIKTTFIKDSSTSAGSWTSQKLLTTSDLTTGTAAATNTNTFTFDLPALSSGDAWEITVSAQQWNMTAGFVTKYIASRSGTSYRLSNCGGATTGFSATISEKTVTFVFNNSDNTIAYWKARYTKML